MAFSSVLASPAQPVRPIRVLIVDDSVVVRGLISRWLSEVPRFQVVGSVVNGLVALDEVVRVSPDIILLDLDMPEMDGLTALPLLLRKSPSSSVLVSSTLTRRNAEISMRCLSLGAVDYVPKPETNREVTTSTVFRNELIAKMEAIGEARARRQSAQRVQSAQQQAPVSETRAAAAPLPVPPSASSPVVVRRAVPAVPRCLAIGASTGGPRAVAEVLMSAGSVLSRVPTLVVQHMPPIFTSVFAEHLRMQVGRQAREPFDGERLLPGVIYVAPGGRHMRVARSDAGPIIRIDDSEPVNFCRPSVDVMFRDVARVFGGSTLGVVLTGMGADGLEGARELTTTGASIYVQDEASSAVWGMPGSIAKAGLAKRVLPLGDIGAHIAAAFDEAAP